MLPRLLRKIRNYRRKKGSKIWKNMKMAEYRLPSKKDWGSKSGSGSEFQAKSQPEKQARVYARSEVKGLIDTFSTLYKRKDRTVCAVSTVCL